MLSVQRAQNVSTGLAMPGEPRTPGTRGRGSPLRGQFVGSETKEETKQSRFDYHLGVRIDVGWLT